MGTSRIDGLNVTLQESLFALRAKTELLQGRPRSSFFSYPPRERWVLDVVAYRRACSSFFQHPKLYEEFNVGSQHQEPIPHEVGIKKTGVRRRRVGSQHHEPTSHEVGINRKPGRSRRCRPQHQHPTSYEVGMKKTGTTTSLPSPLHQESTTYSTAFKRREM